MHSSTKLFWVRMTPKYITTSCFEWACRTITHTSGHNVAIAINTRLMNDDAHRAFISLHLHLLVAFNDFIANVTMENMRIGNLLTVTWLWPCKITGHYDFGNKKIIYPDSLLNFRAVRSITGHLATLLQWGKNILQKLKWVLGKDKGQETQFSVWGQFQKEW